MDARARRAAAALDPEPDQPARDEGAEREQDDEVDEQQRRHDRRRLQPSGP